MRSKIVSREQLSNIARKLSIEKFLTLNSSLKNAKYANLYGIAGNALEAFVGAVYLDHGFNATRKFIIHKLIKPYIDIDNLDSIHENYKSILIQWGQKNKKLVDFRLVEEVIDKHGKLFKMGVYIDNELLLDALHQTKKKAEQTAAEKAISHLELKITDYKLT
jgi:ribonuclease-3